MPDASPPDVVAAADAASPPRPSWVRGWRALALTAVTLVVLAVSAIALWLNDDRDLRAVDARARAMHVALTWEELPDRPAAAADRLAAWSRAAAIAKSLPVWESSSAAPPRRLPHVGEPAPADLIEHVAGLDAAQLSDVDAALDALGDEPLVRHLTANARTLMPEITEARKIENLQRERILADPAGRVAADAIRALRCARALESQLLITELVENSVEMIAVHAIAQRIPDLRAAGGREVAAMLRANAGMFWSQLELAHAGEFLFAHDLAEHPPATLHGGLLDAGEAPPGLLTRVYVVAGRRRMLDAHLDSIAQVRSRDARATLDRAQAVERSFADVSRWSLGGCLAKLLAPAESVMLRNRLRCVQHSLVLAAELDGGDWPLDLLARDGSRLKRIERDGALIAAYSVGPDGVDDGGDPKKDLVFELYGTVTKTTATAPPAPAK